MSRILPGFSLTTNRGFGSLGQQQKTRCHSLHRTPKSQPADIYPSRALSPVAGWLRFGRLDEVNTKRFTETDKWRDPWFRKLSCQAKQLWLYLNDNCDHAGVIVLDLELASFLSGQGISEQHLSELSDRFQRLDADKIWLTGFISFQYGKLSRECRPHVTVFNRLEFHGISLDMVEQASSFVGGTPTYQRLRIIARDGLQCLYTGKPIESLELAEVDHFIPRSKGGLNKDDNLFVVSKHLNHLRKNQDIQVFCAENSISFQEVLQRVCERLAKGSNTLKDKEQDKDKEKEEYKEKETPRMGSAEGKEIPAYEEISAMLSALGFNLFNRPENHHPTQPEQLAALAIIKRPNWKSEMETVMVFGRICRPEDRRFYFPRTLHQLLDNWDESLDKARTYKPNEKPSKHNSRNDGVAIGPTDYGEAAKRKLERQILEARNRGES